MVVPHLVCGLARRGISDPFHPRLGILRSTFSCIFSMRPNGAVGIGKRAEIRSKQLRSCLALYLSTGQTLSSAETRRNGKNFHSRAGLAFCLGIGLARMAPESSHKDQCEVRSLRPVPLLTEVIYRPSFFESSRRRQSRPPRRQQHQLRLPFYPQPQRRHPRRPERCRR